MHRPLQLKQKHHREVSQHLKLPRAVVVYKSTPVVLTAVFAVQEV